MTTYVKVNMDAEVLPMNVVDACLFLTPDDRLVGIIDLMGAGMACTYDYGEGKVNYVIDMASFKAVFRPETHPENP